MPFQALKLSPVFGESRECKEEGEYSRLSHVVGCVLSRLREVRLVDMKPRVRWELGKKRAQNVRLLSTCRCLSDTV